MSIVFQSWSLVIIGNNTKAVSIFEEPPTVKVIESNQIVTEEKVRNVFR